MERRQKSKFEKELIKKYNESENNKNKIIIRALEYLELKRGKVISWELFLKYHSPTSLTAQIYPKQTKKHCDRNSTRSYEHTTVNRSLTHWKVCGFLDEREKKDEDKVNRFSKEYNLNLNFFLNYLKFNFNITLSPIEQKYLTELLSDEKIKKFFYDLYSFKDEKLEINNGTNFHIDLNRMILKLLVGFIHSSVNHTFQITDYHYEIQSFNLKLIKKWDNEIEQKITDINNKYLTKNKPPFITLPSKITHYFIENGIY